MKPKIGIFGSSAGDLVQSIEVEKQLGKVLATKDAILITGAANGLPYEVIKSAKAINDNQEIWAYSPSVNFEDERKLSPDQDLSLYTKLFFIPENYEHKTEINVCRKYRNVSSTAVCDGGIIISGRWGSMNEFTNLFDMGKVIGVLTETGGIADELESLSHKINKPGKAVILFNSDPQMLVNQLLGEIQKRG